jgi:hypothetical protein
LTWYDGPRQRWFDAMNEFQLPAQANKSNNVTKLLIVSQKADKFATISAAQALLDSMRK